MGKSELFSPYKLGQIELKNRIVMAPMTRSRAIGNIPNDIMADYYGQRAEAGLIVTEGTSPSPNGLGYARIPGIFSKDQVEGWKKVTHAVKFRGGHIFVQLMHSGRIGHEANLPKGARVLAPSAIKPKGQIFTDSLGLQDFPVPTAMSLEDLQRTKQEYVQASKNAIEAGFDGVELHGANGYMIEQFLSPHSNQRTDYYGGSVENRCRFLIEVAEEVARVIGTSRLAIRLSPYGVASDMPHYPEIEATYTYLAEHLNKISPVYLHIVDHSSMGAPQVPIAIKQTIRDKYKGTIILAGGFNRESAEAVIASKLADLVAFGKQFLGNPDLVNRLENELPINTNFDFKTFYTPGEKGYTDYPIYEMEKSRV
jgi:N-ethylmaleimide reductase